LKIEKGKTTLILGIETATLSGGASIVADGEILGVVKFHSTKTHSRRQMSGIDFLFKELEIEVNDLSGIAVSIGPGSFTGVRIGLSIAKGLAYGSKKPLIGVSALEALALRIAEPNFVLSPIIDAYRGEVFAQVFTYDYQKKMAFPYKESQPFIGKIEEWLLQIPENSILAGNGVSRYYDVIISHPGKSFRFAPPNRFYLSPEEIALIGFYRFLKGEFADPALIEPIYLRRVDAVPPRK